MNRRWRHEAAKQYDTLQAVSTFTQALPPLATPLHIADVADVYATYSVLHAKNRHPQARAAPGFYYFLADAVQSPAQAAAAAEEAARLRIEQHRHALAVQQQKQAAALGDPAAPSGQIADPAAVAAAAAADPSEPSPQPGSRSLSQRYEAVIPLGSKHPGLTMDLLQKLFLLDGDGHSPSPHLLLAIVDDDGSVSLARLFNYIQPPFEGPETLPPISADQPADPEEESE